MRLLSAPDSCLTGVALPTMTFRLLVFATFIAGFRSFASLTETELHLFRHDFSFTSLLLPLSEAVLTPLGLSMAPFAERTMFERTYRALFFND